MINNQIISFLILLLYWTSNAMAQQDTASLNWSNDYKDDLVRIKQLESQGQNRTAFFESRQLLDRAIEENHLPGIIASITPLTINSFRVEDDALKSVLISLVQNNPQQPVVKAVYDSYLAELLMSYFEQNRYRISQNQGDLSLPWEELERWSTKQFERAIDSLYQTSVNADLLVDVPTIRFKGLLDEDQEPDWELRPRLYDLLQDRLINFLRNQRYHWNPFPDRIDSSDAELMTRIDLTDYLNSVEERNQKKVIQAYHEWESSLLKSNNLAAYFDVIVRRVDYINTLLDHEHRPKSISLLDTLRSKYESHPHRLLLDFKKAEILQQNGDLQKAMGVLEGALSDVRQDPPEEYVGQIKNLQFRIQAPEVSVQVEDVYPSGMAPLVAIQYRNIGIVQLELYSISGEELIDWRINNRDTEETNQFLDQKKALWKDLVNLPIADDYKYHNTEILIDHKMPKGAYALHYLYFREGVRISGTSLFQISDLGLVSGYDGEENKLYVVNGKTGKKISDATVEAIRIQKQFGRYYTREIHRMKELQPGIYLPPEKMSNLFYDVKTRNDRYISQETYRPYSPKSPSTPYRNTVILTDRKVYKPGQNIHFKALTTLSHDLESKLIENQQVTISLRDANHKTVWEKSYRTDEWGSVSGTIPIPISGLKGNWSLTAAPSGHAQIKVEEYQRPNFELSIPDSSIKVDNREVIIAGEAKTFHGFPIQNGQGRVEVHLERRYWFFYRGPEQLELVYSGSFQTNDAGQFKIEFEAKDLKDHDHFIGANYYYSIHATVQAASGEIREISKSIPLDPDQLMVHVDIPEYQLLSDLKPTIVSMQNALQQPQSSELSLKFAQLKAPDQYKVDRYWKIPDNPLLDQRKFAKEVPHMYFDQSTGLDNWKESRTIRTWSATVGDGDTLDIQQYIDQPGYYRLIVSNAKGDTLSLNSFGIGSIKQSGPIVHEPVVIISDKTTAEPGQVVNLHFFTPQKNEGGQILILYPDGTREQYNLDQTKSLTISVDEKDRGGIYVTTFGLLANRFYHKTMNIEVPWSNKELDVDGITALNTLPVRSDTALNLSITDNNNSGAFSEVTVAIYDASLDAYAVHEWLSDHHFFQKFHNPSSVQNNMGQTGRVVNRTNNYWNNRPIVESIFIPSLPHIHFPWQVAPHYRVDRIMPSPVMSFKQSVQEDIPIDANLSIAESGMDQNETAPPPIRKDFAETILFVGKTTTDSTGRVSIPFRTNDKAGRWKIMVFAHTPDLKSGLVTHTFETSQDLLLESYLPGIVRQGDRLELSYTLFNNTEKQISGKLEFSVRSLFDEENKSITTERIDFDLKGENSVSLSVPFHIDVQESGPLILTTRVMDSRGNILDATEEILPVLPSKEIVRDGNVYILNEGEKWSGDEWNFESMEDLQGKVTIRIVQNLHTELLKSIPYLQVTNPVTTDQFFRNAQHAMLGQFITGEIPNFERIYAEWERKGELKSRLAQNEELKYTDLMNTPWVRQSDSGTEQMALLSLYFDDQHIGQVVESNLSKWIESQNLDGGFPWIKDGSSSFYITVRFLNQWNKMKSVGLDHNLLSEERYQAAQQYVDLEFEKQWEKFKKDTVSTGIHQYYFLPYFAQKAYDTSAVKNSDRWQKYWMELKDSLYLNWADLDYFHRAEIGIAAYHLGDSGLSAEIVRSFLDNAIQNNELGTYWKYNHRTSQDGYLGILAKISELLVLQQEESLNQGIIQWVLVNKMTNDWHQNPYVFDLMLSMLKMTDRWTSPSNSIIYNGDKKIEISGLGDFDGMTLGLNKLESLEIHHREGPPIWVGINTQREVQPEDQIIQSGEILHVDKNIVGIKPGDSLRMGDQLTIQLKISSDRDLDYVYIQDPIVPGLDPGISLSGYTWQYGLMYYQTFDAAKVEMFIQHVPKGEYILEYKLGVVRPGQFRHPRTKIQSYFVPEVNGLDQWAPVVEIIK